MANQVSKQGTFARALLIFIALVLLGPSACAKKSPTASAEGDQQNSEVSAKDAPPQIALGDVTIKPASGVWKLLDLEQSASASSGTKSLTLGHRVDPRNTRLVMFVTIARPESGELFNQFLSKLRATSEQRISPRGSASREQGSLQLDCRSYDVESEGESTTAPQMSLMHLEACLVVNSPRGIFFIQGGPSPAYESARNDFDALLNSLQLPATAEASTKP